MAFNWSNKTSNPWIDFSSPLFSLYFFLFHPWTALLCYDCISYEGSVSGTGSGPHRRKDCTSKPLTGTSGDCNISMWDLWQWWPKPALGDLCLTSILSTQVELISNSCCTHVVQVIRCFQICSAVEKFWCFEKERSDWGKRSPTSKTNHLALNISWIQMTSSGGQWCD